MSISKVLIANRGEIAVRIARTAVDMGIASVAVFSSDDGASLHRFASTEAIELKRKGVAAYLDADGLVAAALSTGCDAVHPGYGFLSEDSAFASKCSAAGLTFIGPTPDALTLFGDKGRARAFAKEVGVPLLEGTVEPVTLDQASEFFAALGNGGAMMIKAVSGGGGRGMRPVWSKADIADAYERCRSEALSAFGNADLYVERLVSRARHVEVQIVGDAHGKVAHLWERDCTLQRRNQKLIEIAPSPWLSSDLRSRITDAAIRLAKAAKYSSLGTFEFLVDIDRPGEFAFMEANPRIQVEHTITEEISGVDLVAIQFRVAAGEPLELLGLPSAQNPPSGFAIQLRVNMERLEPDGTIVPAAGAITRFEPPLGPGVRVDSYGYAGYRTNPAFDSLLAKLITTSRNDGFDRAIPRAARALREFRVEGVTTNISLLQALLARPDLVTGDIHTRYVEEQATALADEAIELLSAALPSIPTGIISATNVSRVSDVEDGSAIPCPMSGVLVALNVTPGEAIPQGHQVAVVEAMKMEHVVQAPFAGIVRSICAEVGGTLYEGEPLVLIDPAIVDGGEVAFHEGEGLDEIRPELAEVQARRAAISDEGRTDAVSRRHGQGRRTARENLAALFDDGFNEYGEFTVAAQRGRRSLEELERISPADGLVTGIGEVNADTVGPDRARCMALAYDYTVFAGTQGYFNHIKTDRMVELAHRWRLPTVLYAEGGGGRPGETDWPTVGGLAVTTFARFAGLSGLVPLIGIASGRCFAGNAALLGCSDVIIATRDSNIGMGGPAMIEGGGLGQFRAEDIGPSDVQCANGVIDLLVSDEVEATATARAYLSYFQGRIAPGEVSDQRNLRHFVPANRMRSYDVRAVIDSLADVGSAMELRRHFGAGIITSLARIDGKAIGIIASNSRHLGGAIDVDGADKAVRFMQLCDGFDIPLLSLCDTPGFMVGPEAEKSAQARKFARMFMVANSLTVPCFSIVLRKAYGLGALAMTFGGSHSPLFTTAWPTGEFGGMGLEGGVRLGYRKELEAIENPALRAAFFKEKVGAAYEIGKALSAASYFEIDSVIDPVDSRSWLIRGLRAAPVSRPAAERKRLYIDSW